MAIRVRTVLCLVFTMSVLWGVAEPTDAQPVLPPDDPDVIPGGGITVDTERVLRARELEHDPRQQRLNERALERLQAEGRLVCVSLRDSLALAKDAIDAGRTVPDELAYLGGMIRLQYLVVDREQQDLILLGLADGIDTSDPARPVGEASGQPLLRLEDLVFALRTWGPGNRPARFGCSIDMPDGAQQRFVEALNQANRRGANRNERRRMLAEAIGPQPVRYWGIPAESRLARVMLEADVRMKRLGLGLDDSPVTGVRPLVSGRDARYTRCWFQPDYQPIGVSMDGTWYRFDGPRLRLATSRTATGEDPDVSTQARRFVQASNAKMPQMIDSIHVWGELANTIDLALLASLIRTDGLDRRAGLDLRWVMDPEAGYPLPQLERVKAVEPMVIDTRGGYAAGGVVVDFGPVLAGDARVELDADDLPQDLPSQPAPGTAAWLTQGQP
ncbi:MAG: DUF1598 domain-containing protein [Planctomycetota bacterium]